MTQNTAKIIPPLQAEIASLSHDGRGIATLDGKTTFIAGALPGEIVSFKIVKKHSRYNEAEVIDVIVPSTDRVKPECKHFGVCGGCSMQHLSVQSQLAYKQKALLEQLTHFGNVTPENVLTPLSENVWHYRRKARLGVKYVAKKQKVLVGFREKASRYLTDVEHCPVLHASVGDKIIEIGKLIQSLSIYEHIPQIEVAVSDAKTALIFRHMLPLTEEDLAKLTAFAIEHTFEIFLQPNPPQSITKLYPQDATNLLTYALSEYDLQMHFHPLDFTQVNAEMNPKMIQRAIELLCLSKEDNVLDLFCGLGNFTLPIARFAKQVIGVEGSDEMVLRATANAKSNNIENTEFFMANLAAPDEISAKWIKQKFSKILLDPPRTGAKEIIESHFKHFKAEKIVYVSCNPATLARDAGILVNQLGYSLKSVGIINMFPHTSHVEAIALFEK